MADPLEAAIAEALAHGELHTEGWTVCSRAATDAAQAVRSHLASPEMVERVAKELREAEYAAAISPRFNRDSVEWAQTRTARILRAATGEADSE